LIHEVFTTALPRRKSIMSKSNGWFTVDRDGLAAVAKRRGVACLLLEPVQNSWDEKGVSFVQVDLTPVDGKPRVELRVEDDSPDGFRDLAESYTMYKRSYKVANPEQRGRFNLGEKFLLSISQEASIVSTKGSVLFGPEGRRTGRKKTEAGSVLTATLKMTRDELEEALDLLHAMIPPKGIKTIINGEILREREPVAEDVRTLQTEIQGDEGGFKLTRRQTNVSIYEPMDDETPHLYEMGIQVDEIDCPWHVDIAQKVPLSVDRGSVRQAFRLDVERHVAEIMANDFTEEQAQGGWVATAFEKMEDDDAIRAVTQKRFGDAVSYDPSNPEANKIALDSGFSIIRGRQMSKGAWASVRRAEALSPAGRRFGTPSSDGGIDLGGGEKSEVEETEWTSEMKRLAEYTKKVAWHVSEATVSVELFDDPFSGVEGWCQGSGGGTIGINLSRINIGSQSEVDALLIHECAHLKPGCGDHMTHRFGDELCRIGARLRSFETTL